MSLAIDLGVSMLEIDLGVSLLDIDLGVSISFLDQGVSISFEDLLSISFFNVSGKEEKCFGTSQLWGVTLDSSVCSVSSELPEEEDSSSMIGLFALWGVALD